MSHPFVRSLCALALLTSSTLPVSATTGPGCLRVVNVASNDALNIRARASSSSRIVGVLAQGNIGVIRLEGACVPKTRPWGQRWCPITHYTGDGSVKGYVKARFVRDSECP